MNQRVEFLTDGGDTVRELPLYLVPESEHWLDWFHITMRLTVLGQMTKGLAAESSAVSQPGEDEEDGRLDATAVEKQLESLKWHLWHGNVYRALQLVADLEWDLESQEEPSERAKKLLKAVSEF
ncbi:MAG: ISKra4 family transposase, partial [Planctomycetaceae bacterium]|nr:ISKra4 family transposase [Planctomycetaceae bacterium]